MTKTLHDGEADRKKQVKVRTDAELVKMFDESIADEYDSRAEALRSLMRAYVAGGSDDLPREPPADETLRTVYRAMCELANHDGMVKKSLAETEIATQTGKSAEVVRTVYLAKLCRRGYLRFRSSVGSRQIAYEVLGYNE